MKNRGKRVTIKDVARKAGVTHPTVSRALNADPRVSQKTRERIVRIAEQLGYRPNLIARGLVKSQTRILACIIPDLHPHVQPILRGVVDVCTQNKYGLMLFSADHWSQEDLSYMWVIDNWRVDGVLIYNVVYHDEARDDVHFIRAGGSPVVFINKYQTKRKINAVGVDNFDGVAQAIAHLTSLGHTRIGVMNGGLKSADGMERSEAFKRALAAHGLTYHKELAGCGNYSDEEAFEEMSRILSSRCQLPTAMFCASDLMAVGVIRAAERWGLKVPGDLAVIGFDDIDAGRYFNPSLTTLKPPLREVGVKAADLLVKLVGNPRARPEQLRLNARLIIRESSGGVLGPTAAARIPAVL